MKEYDQLLDTWEDSAENFMMWIIIFCGIEKESDTYKTLKENIITMENLQDFIEIFNGNIDDIAEITEKYVHKHVIIEVIS